MRSPVLASALLLALAVLSAGPTTADRSTSHPPNAPETARPTDRGRTGSESGGAFGRHRTASGWSRFGLPFPSGFGPSRWSTRPPTAPRSVLEAHPGDRWISPPSDRAPAAAPSDRPPAHLVVRLDPPSASLYLDGHWVGRGRELSLPDARLPVTPGTHRLMASHPDHAPRLLHLELDPREERRIEIRLGSPGAPRP